jgi:CRP-like cAMP-binding protein
VAQANSSDGMGSLFLSTLPRSEFDLLASHLEQIHLAHGTTLYAVGDAIQAVYFPTTALISLVGVTPEGGYTEVGMVGWEGMAGLPLFLGVQAQDYEAMCQIEGDGLKMAANVFQEHCYKLPGLRDALLRYTYLRICHISQSAVCNRFHELEQRLCRWLLVAHDHVRSGQLRFTQEFLAMMIGARRPAVGLVAGRLQAAGLIRYHRGEITILNRRGLEALACECYQVMRNALDRFIAR